MTVVGIHTPESKYEADLTAVCRKVKQNQLDFPIAVDSGSKNWGAWGNHYWPSIYLIDAKGQLRYRWDGELNGGDQQGESLMRAKIEELLKEKG